MQLALVSTVMPHTNRVTGNRYRWALAIAVVIVAVFTLVGILSAAILAAALSVPLVYLLYIYDLNVWEDTPGPVVGLVADPQRDPRRPRRLWCSTAGCSRTSSSSSPAQPA